MFTKSLVKYEKHKIYSLRKEKTRHAFPILEDGLSKLPSDFICQRHYMYVSMNDHVSSVV